MRYRVVSAAAAVAAVFGLSAALLVVPADAASGPVAAVDDTAQLAARTTRVVDVLANDTWTGAAVLSVPAAGDPGAPAHGAVALTTATVGGIPRPALAYTPDPDWFGVDTFTYTLTDDTAQDSVATVTATTAPLAPSAGGDAATIGPRTSVRIAVLGNDSDPYGGDLTVTSIASPAHGIARIEGNVVVYRPDSTWVGWDSFPYRITSASGATARGRIAIRTLASTPGHSLTLAATPSVTVLRRLEVRGTVDPLDGGPVAVTISRKVGTTWAKVATATPNSLGRWYVVVRPSFVGTIAWQARARWADGSSAVVLTRSTVVAAADPVVSGPLTRASVPYSYRNGCKVGPSQLRRISINYWDYDGVVRRGDIIVRDREVRAVRAVFRKAFDERFPFKQIRPVDYFYAGGARNASESDIAAMNAGNTSAFNCRTVTGNPLRTSQHTYGNAIDINTFENPYVTSSRVYPAAAEYPYYRHRAENLDDPGVITWDSVVARSFRAFGWLWGARWSHPDYQHFSSNGG